MTLSNSFQRVGATSNTEAGRGFEDAAHIFFDKADASEGVALFLTSTKVGIAAHISPLKSDSSSR